MFKVVNYYFSLRLNPAKCNPSVKCFYFQEDDDDWICFSTLNSHTSTVWSISFAKDGKRIASCSEDKTVKIWKEFQPGNQEGIATEGKDPAWKCVCTIGGFHTRYLFRSDY